MLLAEVFGKFLAVQLVEVLAGISQLVGAGEQQRIVGIVDDTFQMWHLGGVNLGGYVVTDEEQLGIRVIDNVVNLLCHKFM